MKDLYPLGLLGIFSKHWIRFIRVTFQNITCICITYFFIYQYVVLLSNCTQRITNYVVNELKFPTGIILLLAAIVTPVLLFILRKRLIPISRSPAKLKVWILEETKIKYNIIQFYFKVIQKLKGFIDQFKFAPYKPKRNVN